MDSQLLQDCMDWLEFVEDLIREITDSKCDQFKLGQIDGLRLAADMLRDYLVEYPGFVDPVHKFDQFKLK